MNDDKHSVGYGKPPVETQWKPGQSGNPSGRPKKSVRLIEVLLEEANAPITITENGQTKDVVKLQPIVKSLIARAMQGDIRAVAMFMKLWNPTEIAALEWYEQQSYKQLKDAYATAQAIMDKHRAKSEASAPPAPSAPSATSVSPADADPEFEAFLKAKDEATKQGQPLEWEDWLDSQGVPRKYIGDDG